MVAKNSPHRTTCVFFIHLERLQDPFLAGSLLQVPLEDGAQAAPRFGPFNSPPGDHSTREGTYPTSGRLVAIAGWSTTASYCAVPLLRRREHSSCRDGLGRRKPLALVWDNSID